MLADLSDIPGVSKVSSGNGESAKADAIAGNAVVLDLALVEAASGNARRVTEDNGGGNVIRVDARFRDGVGNDETTLGVAAERDLGVGAVGFGLLDELGHDRTTFTTLLDVAGNGGCVVNTLDGDAIGTERGSKVFRDGRTDRAAEVLSHRQYNVQLRANKRAILQAQWNHERR
jgi:hypothetical protein